MSANRPMRTVLLADIGGTGARFALLVDGTAGTFVGLRALAEVEGIG
jgi:glucokinase